MRIEPLRAVLPNPALIASAETFFGVVKEHYLEYRARGMFETARPAGLWVYRLREGSEVYTGVLAALPADQLADGSVRRHEGTLAASEQSQLQLLVLRSAAVKPVLLTYPHSDGVAAALTQILDGRSPTLAIDDAPAIRHELFLLEAGSPAATRLAEAFSDSVAAAYIADGHHRVRSLELYNARRAGDGLPAVPLFAGLFASDQVRVRPYHRVVQLPVGLTPLALLARLSQLCEVEVHPEPIAPPAVHHLTLLLGGETFRLSWRPEVMPDHGIVLDAGLFNRLVAGPIFGIDDVRTDTRIQYVPGTPGIDAVVGALAGRPDCAGFLLHGLEARDMFAVVDAGMVMPPKSTWFEPRMRNGLAVMEV